ncbi:MAG: hypothetical protein LAQ30_28280 [Acidobacteriia bacterium]|nr:hypothetical protein [Terriglobia bacterium]
MELGNSGKTLFFGTASNMIAPDLITNPVPLNPGLEVWAMQATAAVKQ